ncbi:hypothetical protein [Clostridium sp.]|uniref:hypothetical protein n=1 Tax=Clostridium sp. TaxID=1506 RepID=UPI003217144B
MKNIERFQRMESWINEKSLMALKQTAGLVDLLRGNKENIDENLYNEIMGYLSGILGYNSNIYSLIFDRIDEVNGDRVFEYGKVGLEETLYELEIVKSTPLRTQIKELTTVIEEISVLIQGDRTNRTLIHEVLAGYQSRTKEVQCYIEELEQSIDDVTMGKIEWGCFIEIANRILPTLQMSLVDLNRRLDMIKGDITR